MQPAKQILVAEDNAALASVIRFNIQRAGFDVTVVSNGRQALEAVMAKKFDLVITDEQMPEMTGSDFCRRLRDLSGYEETPVMMLTAKGLELELDRLRAELGIKMAFLKPFSPMEVVQAVEGCLLAAT